MAYEDDFLASGQMNEKEYQEAQNIVQAVQTDGGLFRRHQITGEYVTENGQTIPIDWYPLRGRRFLVDRGGRVWRMFAAGSPTQPNRPDGGGSPWRYNAVEMWTGYWRKIPHPRDPKTWVYAKCTRGTPIDPGINEKPGISAIDYYLSRGRKHPYDKPDNPTEFQITVMERQETGAEPVILAKMQEELQREGVEDAEKIVAAEKKKMEARHTTKPSPIEEYRAMQAKAKSLRIRANQPKVKLAAAIAVAEAKKAEPEPEPVGAAVGERSNRDAP